MVNIIGPYRSIIKIKCEGDDEEPPSPTPTPYHYYVRYHAGHIVQYIFDECVPPPYDPPGRWKGARITGWGQKFVPELSSPPFNGDGGESLIPEFAAGQPDLGRDLDMGSASTIDSDPLGTGSGDASLPPSRIEIQVGSETYVMAEYDSNGFIVVNIGGTGPIEESVSVECGGSPSFAVVGPGVATTFHWYQWNPIT